MKVRAGLSQRFNIGDYESLEVHVEIEEDFQSSPAEAHRELSATLSTLFEKECIARLTEVQERRAGNTPAGELQQQVRAAAPKK